MGTTIKHPVPDRVKPSFVILTSGHSDAQPWASECPDVKNYNWQLNTVWHRMFYSCTHMATVGGKGLKIYRLADEVSLSVSDGVSEWLWFMVVRLCWISALVWTTMTVVVWRLSTCVPVTVLVARVSICCCTTTHRSVLSTVQGVPNYIRSDTHSDTIRYYRRV